MKKLLLPLCVLCVLALNIPASGQKPLPDKSSIADIAGKSKVYIDVVDPSDRFKGVFKKSGLIEANKADEADFVIEYRQIGETVYVTDFRIPQQTGSLTVYYLRDAKKVIVWQDTATDGGRHPSPDDKLLKRFLKDRDKK